MKILSFVFTTSVTIALSLFFISTSFAGPRDDAQAAQQNATTSRYSYGAAAYYLPPLKGAVETLNNSVSSAYGFWLVGCPAPNPQTVAIVDAIWVGVADAISDGDTAYGVVDTHAASGTQYMSAGSGLMSNGDVEAALAADYFALAAGFYANGETELGNAAFATAVGWADSAVLSWNGAAAAFAAASTAYDTAASGIPVVAQCYNDAIGNLNSISAAMGQ